ncbi:MAG TPA: LTA synthase family protein [Planococcus sp. (in: firmicutes)]|nr:LTA synthase family protein [Planococcus sp. (in: firmicutes)]
MKKEHFKKFLTSHLVVVTAILVLKIFFLRYLLFGKADITQALVLELSYILIFTALIELIAGKWKPGAFLLLNLIFSTLFLAVVMYHAFFGRIVTYFALFQLGQVGTINESVSALMRPIYFLFFAEIVVLTVLLLTRKYPIHNYSLNKKFLVLPVLVLAIGVSFINFQTHKDEAISNNVLAAEEKGILNYEALEFYLGPAGQAPIEVNVSVENSEALIEEIRKLKGLEYIPPEEREFFGAAEGRNLIVIQVESMQSFPIGLELEGEEITPNLNKLIGDSFYFPNTAQQTGPGNTADAEFIINTSLYPTAFNPTSQTFADRAFPSLPRLLKGEGYTTSTFHADDISFWNRDELYPALGIEHYYYGEFFGNEDVIGIGPSDEVMFQKAMPVLRASHMKDEPFYTQLVGLTSHHPFHMPEEQQQLSLPEDFQDSLTGEYLVSINYMDRIIHDFIEQLKEEGIYENSVIAIFGDHFGLQQSAIHPRDVELVTDLLGHEYQTIDRLKIPFILHAPGITDEGETIEQQIGQLDMMPTIANLLGLPLDDMVIFGQDVLNHEETLLGARYYLPVGSFWNDEILFIPEKGFEDGTAYDLETEEIIADFEKYRDDYDRVLHLEYLSDAYMESLPKR